MSSWVTVHHLFGTKTITYPLTFHLEPKEQISVKLNSKSENDFLMTINLKLLFWRATIFIQVIMYQLAHNNNGHGCGSPPTMYNAGLP